MTPTPGAGMSEFFNEAKEQSVVKATIVAKYFVAWARVIAGWAPKMAYIDLYAGPGRYDDGTMSTPLKVIETAIAEPKLADRLVVILNDADAANVAKLKAEIAAMPGVAALKFPPVVDNEEVDAGTAKDLQEMSLIPSFSFIDPWGYKGLRIGHINHVGASCAAIRGAEVVGDRHRRAAVVTAGRLTPDALGTR